MDLGTETPSMPGPSAAMLHNVHDGIIKKSTLINSGHDTNHNIHRNYSINIEVKVPDAIDYIKTAAEPFVSCTRTNQSIGADSEAGETVEICDMMPPDPSSLPVSSVADRYVRSMLECKIGYPLYEPHPFSQHSDEYSHNGVNVGDVGFVREDGTFDFLFNICPPHNELINPPILPNGFSLRTRGHSKTRAMRPLAPKTCFFSKSVKTTEYFAFSSFEDISSYLAYSSGEYICEGSEGAILELPEGAIQDEAINRGPFVRLAKSHGVEWYKYTIKKGRDISNGSLYLVTSFTRCTKWGIAVFDRQCQPGQGLKFIRSPLSWKDHRGFNTRVADPDISDTPNQCVFLRGYKIMVRQDIFNDLYSSLPLESDSEMAEMPSSSPKAGSSRPIRVTRQRATRLRGGGGSDFLLTDENFLNRTTVPTAKMSDKVVLQANFNSSPIHPSDLINAALLSQFPDAKIALTHDDVWCDILRDKFPTLNYGALRDIARLYTSTVDENGCISLEITSTIAKAFSDLVPSENTSAVSATPQTKRELSEPMNLEQISMDRQMEELSYPSHSSYASLAERILSESISRMFMLPKVLRDLRLPREYFPLWGQCLNSERSVPHFLLLPEFSEEGVLTPSEEGYIYQVIRRRTTENIFVDRYLDGMRKWMADKREATPWPADGPLIQVHEYPFTSPVGNLSPFSPAAPDPYNFTIEQTNQTLYYGTP